MYREILNKCPICTDNNVDEIGSNLEYWFVSCVRCGNFRLKREIHEDHELDGRDIQRAYVSHISRKATVNRQVLYINNDIIESVRGRRIPPFQGQLNNLIEVIGDAAGFNFGDMIEVNAEQLVAEVAALDAKALDFLVKQAESQALMVSFGFPDGEENLQLTAEGWARYQELKENPSRKSRSAFMAMQFNDSILDIAFSKCFVPAANQAGFKLDTVSPSAGLIDHHIQEEILASNFVIADLTHGNNGAYWEAGYATGLGKPVIYTCRNDVFEEGKTHFDTAHHQTVIWDPDDLESALVKLRSVIRVTFPEIAQL